MVLANTTQTTLNSLSCSAEPLHVIEISSDSEDDVRICEPRLRKNNHRPTSVGWGNDIIELTDSDSSYSTDLPDILSPLIKGPPRKQSAGSRQWSSSEGFIPLYVDTDDDEVSDKDCILVLNDPPGSRRPVRGTHLAKAKNVTTANTLLDVPKKNAMPELSPSSRGSRGSPSKSKKGRNLALKGKEQTRLQNYASELFARLNKDVFGDRLPKDTTLEWSKRLLTTAGRARWHRSRDGVHTTKIELASKILDSDERIRNTLSHEMCHLACWVIDNLPQEGHGRLFKLWASKVMTKYPNIHISTRHNYEISYPYEWKCEKCSKTYGRYSKSIRPDECVCGACKVGKLIPLFNERKQMTPKVSRMAIDRPRDSPCLVLESPTKKGSTIERTPVASTDIIGNGVPDLATLFEGISINDTAH